MAANTLVHDEERELIAILSRLLKQFLPQESLCLSVGVILIAGFGEVGCLIHLLRLERSPEMLLRCFTHLLERLPCITLIVGFQHRNLDTSILLFEEDLCPVHNTPESRARPEVHLVIMPGGVSAVQTRRHSGIPERSAVSRADPRVLRTHFHLSRHATAKEIELRAALVPYSRTLTRQIYFYTFSYFYRVAFLFKGRQAYFWCR